MTVLPIEQPRAGSAVRAQAPDGKSPPLGDRLTRATKKIIEVIRSGGEAVTLVQEALWDR